MDQLLVRYQELMMVLLHFFQFIKSDPGQGNFEKLRVGEICTIRCYWDGDSGQHADSSGGEERGRERILKVPILPLVCDLLLDRVGFLPFPSCAQNNNQILKILDQR